MKWDSGRLYANVPTRTARSPVIRPNIPSLISAVIVKFDGKSDEGQIVRAIAPAWFEILKILETDPNAARENYPRYVDNAKSLGKLLLLARRLCEAGCGFVTVTTNFVWDMNADQNNADSRLLVCMS